MEEYQRWIMEHLIYAREQCPGICSPYGVIVIGMSAKLSEDQKSRLEQSNITTRAEYEVITYDMLLERGENLLRDLPRENRSSV